MITNADREVLGETYRNATMAVESIYSVIRKVDDEDLALDLNRQVGKFVAISDKAEDELLKAGHWPPEYAMGKVALKAGIMRKTMRDSSCGHIADMLIQGNTKGIIETTKILNEHPSAKKTYCEMAEELIAFEQKNIERMKEYL
ncbi:MAG: hypothetical protein ACLU61_09135 [Lachnospiraceae bacterium]